MNLINSEDHHRVPSLLLSIDAEKAFIQAHWGYLSKVLEKFGIVGEAHRSIIALYSAPSAYVQSSSYASKALQITNGTRQGCPLSPFICMLLMEPLAESIRHCNDIRGIMIGPQQHKIGLFADHVIITVMH